jgi:hypothetical protein
MSVFKELSDLVEAHMDVCGHHTFLQTSTQNEDGKIVYGARIEFSSSMVRSYDSDMYYATFEEAKKDAALVALVALRRRFNNK